MAFFIGVTFRAPRTYDCFDQFAPGWWGLILKLATQRRKGQAFHHSPIGKQGLCHDRRACGGWRCGGSLLPVGCFGFSVFTMFMSNPISTFCVKTCARQMAELLEESHHHAERQNGKTRLLTDAMHSDDVRAVADPSFCLTLGRNNPWPISFTNTLDACRGGNRAGGRLRAFGMGRHF